MYRFNNNTGDKKINIDDILDGLNIMCEAYKNTNEKYNEERNHTKEDRNSDVYNRDTYEGGKARTININIELPSITTTIRLGSSRRSERQREQDDYDRRVDQAWRNFYAANS